LGLLAGFGMSCAKSETGGDNVADSKPPMKTCYKVAYQPALLTDPRWARIAELEAWAKAERDILHAVKNERIDFDILEPKIAAADTAASNAKVVVSRGLLQKETYQLASEILDSWHRDIALSHSTIKCYEEAVSMPLIENVSQKLDELTNLQLQGTITPAAVNQARAAMNVEIKKAKTPAVAEELSQFLIQLLGY